MTTEITDEQVAAFLRNNPDFFNRRLDLLELLQLPDARGGTVSLLERQAAVLRDRNQTLRERLGQLVEVARENDRLFEKTRRMALRLLEANDLFSLATQLCQGLESEFHPDNISLLLYHNTTPLPECNGRVRHQPLSEIPEALQVMLQGNRAICGALRPNELACLFPGNYEAIQSAAMVPLFRQQPLGLLAIGSHDPSHFKSSMDTIFINHIGEVMSRRIAEFQPATRAPREKRA